MQRRYAGKAAFLAVYVREAHPADGWRMASNDRVGITVPQPRTLLDRTLVAQTCCDKLQISMPLLVDALDDRVAHAYSGMPDRLYVIDRHGRVAYKGGRGPFGFNPQEMEQSLVMLLLEEKGAAQKPAVAVLDNATAWSRLPEAERGRGAPLPTWARQLAGALPQTTAAMLELDRIQRTGSPLDPKLRAKVRWLVADDHRCAYSQAVARADLRRAGLTDDEVNRFCRQATEDFEQRPPAERRVLAFARKLSAKAYALSDDEVGQLRQEYGEQRLVALVLLVAYANFQDRLLLALGSPIEPNGPLPPIDVAFKHAPLPHSPAGKTARAKEIRSAAVLHASSDSSLATILDPLQSRLDDQRNRSARIRIPTWEEFLAHKPVGYNPDRPVRIRWSLVCSGYQPELAGAWVRCLRLFGAESQVDRICEESLFWVITQSLQCFY
jgi:alkylhydroperoxidase family enzyme